MMKLSFTATPGTDNKVYVTVVETTNNPDDHNFAGTLVMSREAWEALYFTLRGGIYNENECVMEIKEG